MPGVIVLFSLAPLRFLMLGENNDTTGLLWAQGPGKSAEELNLRKKSCQYDQGCGAGAGAGAGAAGADTFWSEPEPEPPKRFARSRSRSRKKRGGSGSENGYNNGKITEC